MPLHKKRLRKRGFNQTFLLIKDWDKLTKKMGANKYYDRISHDILFRKRYTESQTGLGKDQRKKNMKNAFYIKYPLDIKGKSILLVDDVYTTGATVNECAKVLLKGGAENISILTLARTI